MVRYRALGADSSARYRISWSVLGSLARDAAIGSPADTLQCRPGVGGGGSTSHHRRDLTRWHTAGVSSTRARGKAAAQHAADGPGSALADTRDGKCHRSILLARRPMD